MRIKVNTVTLAEGRLFEDHYEETREPFATFNIQVEVPDDRDPHISWVHPKVFREWERYQAAEFAAKVLARGWIETDNWTALDDRDEPTLEEKFEQYAEEEARERAGY